MFIQNIALKQQNTSIFLINSEEITDIILFFKTLIAK